jgi:hypothetical protein
MDVKSPLVAGPCYASFFQSDVVAYLEKRGASSWRPDAIRVARSQGLPCFCQSDAVAYLAKREGIGAGHRRVVRLINPHGGYGEVTISIRSSYNIVFILKNGTEKEDIIIAEIVGSQLQSIRHSIHNPDSKSQGS